MMRHHLHMPSYFLGTFTEYPFLLNNCLYIRCVKRQKTDQSIRGIARPDPIPRFLTVGFPL